VLVLIAALPTLASGETPLVLAAAATRSLGFVKAVSDVGLESATCITLSPHEQYLYVASLVDDALAVFARLRIYFPLAEKNYP
jgi:hypothetical protein